MLGFSGPLRSPKKLRKFMSTPNVIKDDLIVGRQRLHDGRAKMADDLLKDVARRRRGQRRRVFDFRRWMDGMGHVAPHAPNDQEERATVQGRS